MKILDIKNTKPNPNFGFIHDNNIKLAVPKNDFKNKSLNTTQRLNKSHSTNKLSLNKTSNAFRKTFAQKMDELIKTERNN